jgi:hypothetical protein
MPRQITLRQITLRLITLWLGLYLQAAPLVAGAWPREAGTGFASLSFWPAQAGAGNYTALFAEWGLSPRLTLGLDAGRSVSGQTKAVVFLRAPVMAWADSRVAAEIGWGEIAGQRVIRPGLSFGRSLANAYGAGWFAVDTVLELDLETRDMDVKADITLGFTPSPPSGPPVPWTAMLQVQTGIVAIKESLLQLREAGIRPQPSFMRIVPSVTYRLRDGVDLELGFYRNLTGSDERGFKLGLWTRF